MHHSKAIDLASVGFYGASLWVGDHWLTILSGSLLGWRCVQAFILEPLGIFWPKPKGWRQF